MAEQSYIDTLKCDIVKYKYQPHHYQYSDIGFILLQWVVEIITKCSVIGLCGERIHHLPMRATRTLFLPSRRYEKREIVPTVTQDALRNAKEICGYTQDEVAAYMGGVAEAGLYSTASDLADLSDVSEQRDIERQALPERVDMHALRDKTIRNKATEVWDLIVPK